MKLCRVVKVCAVTRPAGIKLSTAISAGRIQLRPARSGTAPRQATVFKPRRGGLFIETDALQVPSFLFFGGAELYRAHGTGTVPRFNGARTNRIRHAPESEIVSFGGGRNPFRFSTDSFISGLC